MPPHGPGPRLVLAKTCSACGFFRPGWMFYRNKVSTFKNCKTCHKLDVQSRKHSHGRHSAEYARLLQEVSLPGASMSGAPIDPSDIDTCSRTDISLLGMALRIHRTYYSIVTLRNAYGITTPALPEPTDPQQFIIEFNKEAVA